MLGSPFTGRDGGWRWGKLRSHGGERSQQGCGGQSGQIPTQRISVDHHSPAPRGLSAHPPGRVGGGAEARASEVRPQGEDWGWLREHSLKGATAPQLAGRESGKKSAPA